MSFRKRTGFAVALAAITAAGLATAGSAAPTAPPPPETLVTKTLRGTCDVAPVGPQPITAELKLTLPTSAYVGDSVQPKDVGLKLVFPPEFVAALKQHEIATVEGMAGVQLAADKTEMPARGQMPKTALPETGELAVDVPAKIAAVVRAAKPGKITFTAGPIELLLASYKPDFQVGEPKPVICVPEEGQDPGVGSVSVLTRVARQTNPGTPGKQVPGSRAPSGSAKPGAPDPKPAKPRPTDEADPCEGDIPPDAYNFWSYYPLDVHADVRKLKSGIDFGPGYLSTQLFFWFEGEVPCGAVGGDVLLPTAHGSFVAFEFMPATSDVTTVQVGRAEGRLNNGVFKGTAKMDMVLSKVKVNGTPLNVGQKCKTAEPIVLHLLSKPEEWDVFLGGTIETDVTIPKFGGCFGSENLDPLFTGLISGPGNHIKMTFGNIVICEPPDQPCVPPLPVKGRR